MTVERDARAQSYEAHRARGNAALDVGDLEAACEAFEAALACARREGDTTLVDRAFCNRAAVLIALGRGDDELPELRRLIMAHGSSEIGWLAAYNVARAFELRRESKKGLFYARIAVDRACALGRSDWEATSRNQVANFLVADSHFAEAADEYSRALELLADGAEEWRLTVVVNLGYCDVMTGRLRHGLSRLYQGLRGARRKRLRRLEAIASIDLCFAHLEGERARHALRHGSRGLALAEAIGETDLIKNGLFLVGEAAAASSDEETARRRFAELQDRYYPGQTYVADLLLAVDVRKMINLRA